MRIAAFTTVLGLGGLGGYALSSTRAPDQPVSTLADHGDAGGQDD